MANLGEFLFSLAKDSGIDTDSDQFKGFMGQTQFESADIPSEIVSGIKSGFLTLESAKNNSDLNKHFKGKHLDMIDQSVAKGIQGLNLPDNVMGDITGETDSRKKIELAFSKANDHFKALQPESTNDPELIEKNKELSGKVNSLTEEINKHPQILQEQKDNLTNQFNEEKIGFRVGEILSSYKISENYQPDYVKWSVNEALGKSPFKIKPDMKLYQRDNEDLLAQKENQEFMLKDFIEETIAPFLQTTDKPPEPNGQPVIVKSDEPIHKANTTESIIAKKMNLGKPKTQKFGASKV